MVNAAQFFILLVSLATDFDLHVFMDILESS